MAIRMDAKFVVWLSLLSWVHVGSTELCNAQDPLTSEQSVSPLQDDATIHDITFVGKTSGWAVGDHGVVWKTIDGGKQWELMETVPDADEYSFRSTCFLTNRVGWIVGGTISPLGASPHGVILFTQDAGKSWTKLTDSRLPYLKSVKFFDLERGICVGEKNIEAPAGVLMTTDGGKNWTPVASELSAAWNSGDFLNSANGLVVGPQGQQGILGNGNLLRGNASQNSLVAIQDVQLTRNGKAWLVGDGAIVLHSTNNGVTWSPPATPLPPKIADFTDFQTVYERDGEVWITGAPGSVIWHSADSGQSWIPQSTGDPTPLHTIYFSDEKHGVAAGLFGRICVTDDGGKTWRNARGGHRRLASWTIHANVDKTPLEYLNRWSREDGYRSAVSILVRHDLGADAHAAESNELRLHHAVTKSGGNASSINWRLPLRIPGLERSRANLLKEWNALYDQRLQQAVFGHLVARIRMYRPSLILLNEPERDDAATALMHDIVKQAIEQAADPTRYPEHQQVGLPIWHVRKLAVQKNLDSTGTIRQNQFEILPRSGTTLDLATNEARSLLGSRRNDVTADPTFDIVWTSPNFQSRQSTLLGDLKISPGSAARRISGPLDPAQIDALTEQVAQRRRISSITTHAINAPAKGAQLMAQMDSLLRDLNDEQAAAQLADLAMTYRRNGQWDFAEQVYSQLVAEFPNQPVASHAMLWLVEFWTSSEIRWQRLRQLQAGNYESGIDQEILRANFEKLSVLAEVVTTPNSIRDQLKQLRDPSQVNAATHPVVIGNSPGGIKGLGESGSQREMRTRRWYELAGGLTDKLLQTHPHLFADDQMQFVIASLYRQRKQNDDSDEIYRRYLQRLNDADPWHVAAKGEIYLLRPNALSPKPVIACKQAVKPPVLDGILTDLCWSKGSEILLGSEQADGTYVGADQSSSGRTDFRGPQPLVIFSYDDDYLYLGINVPKDQRLTYEQTQFEGRPRDAQLGGFDYVTIQFDCDRDYSTFYQFDVDQRGWTREKCWDDWSFDPKWYVAATQDDRTWSVEAAIPLPEIVPGSAIGQTWAVGITRIAPGVEVQSWTKSGGEIPLPPRFGLMRFQ